MAAHARAMPVLSDDTAVESGLESGGREGIRTLGLLVVVRLAVRGESKSATCVCDETRPILARYRASTFRPLSPVKGHRLYITVGDEIIAGLSERFYFLRYVGFSSLRKNAEPESSGAKARWITRALYRSGKPRAYIPRAETRRVFAWASSGRSERMPSQFFSNWV